MAIFSKNTTGLVIRGVILLAALSLAYLFNLIPYVDFRFIGLLVLVMFGWAIIGRTFPQRFEDYSWWQAILYWSVIAAIAGTILYTVLG